MVEKRVQQSVCEYPSSASRSGVDSVVLLKEMTYGVYSSELSQYGATGGVHSSWMRCAGEDQPARNQGRCLILPR
jgi:hypothetical protein